MDVQIFDSAAAVADRAADLFAELVRRKPAARLGLATGATPRPLYAELVRRCRAGELDLGQVETFNLDEYVGLGPDHPRSFRRAMRELLFEPAGIAPERAHLPRGDAPDPGAEAASYEARVLAHGGLDLQLLGLGRNGHIGFNEPGTDHASRTRVATLAASTVRANALGPPGFSEPPRAITMGIGTILQARALLLIATGTAKAAAVAAALEGPIRTSCPATALRAHPDLSVLLDPLAARALEGVG